MKSDPPNNILIVDDQPVNLYLLAEILRSQGYQIREVLDGQQALDAVQSALPHLILLDIMMPKMDGYEVCARLKLNPLTQTIPIIFLSALDTTKDKVKGFAVGGVDYITKPFERQEVLARVKLHLELRNLHQTLKEKNEALTTEIEQRKVTELNLKTALDSLKVAQEQIIAREKLAALGTLMAGIAHELRNPLNFINNYAEGSIELADELNTVLKQAGQTLNTCAIAQIQELLADLHQNAVTIHENGVRANLIITSMMQHVRPGESELQLISLNDLLEQAISLIVQSQSAEQSQIPIRITRNYDSTLGKIYLLPQELNRAFINLIDNAFYALYAKQSLGDNAFIPELSITTQNLGSEVEIRFSDNGLGIPFEQQKRLFEPFFSTKPPGEGTGLGLSLSHEVIVKRHQGRISLDTEDPTLTQFVIRIPVKRQIHSPSE